MTNPNLKDYFQWLVTLLYVRGSIRQVQRTEHVIHERPSFYVFLNIQCISVFQDWVKPIRDLACDNLVLKLLKKVRMTAEGVIGWCNYSCTWFIARSVKIWLWSCWGNRAWFNAFSQGTNWKWVFDHSFNTFNPFIPLICWVTVEYPMITGHRRHNLQNYISILL